MLDTEGVIVFVFVSQVLDKARYSVNRTPPRPPPEGGQLKGSTLVHTGSNWKHCRKMAGAEAESRGP